MSECSFGCSSSLAFDVISILGFGVQCCFMVVLICFFLISGPWSFLLVKHTFGCVSEGISKKHWCRWEALQHHLILGEPWNKMKRKGEDFQLCLRVFRCCCHLWISLSKILNLQTQICTCYSAKDFQDSSFRLELHLWSLCSEVLSCRSLWSCKSI